MRRHRASWLRRTGVTTVSALTLAGAGAAALALEAAPAHANAGFAFTRLAGANRFATAATISTQSFPTGAATALLASGANFPDALAAAYLAGNENGGAGAPILLTDPNTLSSETMAALSTLKVKSVVILGGTGAVSAAVANQVSGMTSTSSSGGNITVSRVAGPTRYDTAQAIDTQAAPLNTVGTSSSSSGGGTTSTAGTGTNACNTSSGTTSGPKTAILATGVNFPDALGAGALAFRCHFPLILTDGSQATLSTQATNVLSSDGIQKVIVVGGFAAIPQSQRNQLTSMNITLDQEAGSDRSGTSVALAQDGITNYGFSNAHFNLANGFDPNFPGTGSTPPGFSSDALAGAPHGGLESAPTLITLSPTNGGGVCGFAMSNARTEAGGHIFGGTGAVTDATAQTIEGCAGNANPPVPAGPSAAPTAVTSLPQLVSASVVSTVTTAQATSSMPAGTTVAYTFSKPVLTDVSSDFKIYTASDVPVTGTSSSGAGGSTTVDVLFSQVTATSGSPSASSSAPDANASDYSLATVVSGAVTTSSGTTNPDGAASIGSPSTTTLTPGKTNAPNLVSVGNFVAGVPMVTTAVTFTFDKPATVVSPTSNLSGFNLVTTANATVMCGGMSASAPIGSGSTTITVTCSSPGTTLSSSTIARGYVTAGTVTDSTGKFMNPLEAVPVANSGLTTGADLQSATLMPATTSGGTNQVLYTFDQAVVPGSSALTAANFQVYNLDGTELSGSGTPTQGTGTNANQVAVAFGTSSFANVVGADVSTAQGNIEPDSVGVVNSSAPSFMPGVVDAPQLTSVALASSTNSVGTASETATYTFSQPLTSMVTSTGFHLYQANGTEFTGGPTSCTVGTTTGTANQVTCSGFSTTATPSAAATTAQVAGTVLGTVDAGSVTGGTGTSGHTNPEGAANTTGGTPSSS